MIKRERINPSRKLSIFITFDVHKKYYGKRYYATSCGDNFRNILTTFLYFSCSSHGRRCWNSNHCRSRLALSLIRQLLFLRVGFVSLSAAPNTKLITFIFISLCPFYRIFSSLFFYLSWAMRNSVRPLTAKFSDQSPKSEPELWNSSRNLSLVKKYEIHAR